MSTSLVTIDISKTKLGHVFKNCDRSSCDVRVTPKLDSADRSILACFHAVEWELAAVESQVSFLSANISAGIRSLSVV